MGLLRAPKQAHVIEYFFRIVEDISRPMKKELPMQGCITSLANG
jgi:hypothetical protein